MKSICSSAKNTELNINFKLKTFIIAWDVPNASVDFLFHCHLLKYKSVSFSLLNALHFNKDLLMAFQIVLLYSHYLLACKQKRCYSDQAVSFCGVDNTANHWSPLVRATQPHPVPRWMPAGREHLWSICSDKLKLLPFFTVEALSTGRARKMTQWKKGNINGAPQCCKDTVECCHRDSCGKKASLDYVTWQTAIAVKSKVEA